MLQEQQLENQFLTALDNGWIHKTLASGKLSYQTHTTVWGGTQPERLSLGSGLSRRFLILIVNPTDEIIKQYSDAYDKGENIAPDMREIEEIQEAFNELIEGVHINSLTFSDEYKTFRNSLGLAHYEKALFDNLALGYHVIRYSKEELEIGVDDTLKDLMVRAVRMRGSALMDGSAHLILDFMGDREWPRTELTKELAHRLSMPYEKVKNEVTRLIRDGDISTRKKKGKAKKPTEYLKKAGGGP